MKIYTLDNSETLDNIRTYNVGLTACLEINYKKTQIDTAEQEENSIVTTLERFVEPTIKHGF